MAVLALPVFNLLPIEPRSPSRVSDCRARSTPIRWIVSSSQPPRHYGAPLLTADYAILTYAAGGHVQTIDALR